MMVKLRAEDPHTGRVCGWRKHSRLVDEKRYATWYNSPSSALIGLETAEKHWPQYRWRVFQATGDVEVGLERREKQRFTREEVLALVLAEREECARILESGFDEFALANRLRSRPKELPAI
jgi:hypothetical protein